MPQAPSSAASDDDTRCAIRWSGRKRAACGAYALRTPTSTADSELAKNHHDISYEGLAALLRMRTMVRSASRAWMAARRASSRSAESLADERKF